MKSNLRPLIGVAVAMLLAACAATPPVTPAAAPAVAPATAASDAATTNASAADDKPVPPGQKKYKWSKASEAEVAAALDKKFAEAAKQFVQLKRNDQLMFCKKYREMGSTIRTLHCITEAELRKQVEDSDDVRAEMRQRMGRCDISHGCQAN